MKKILLIVLVFATYLNVASQSIDQYQYWYDSNYSSAIVVNNTPSGDLVLNTGLNTTGVSAGLHNLNFRAKSDDGKWSTTHIEQFYNTGNWKIDSYEYWFDDYYDSKITNSVAPEQTYLLTSDFNTSAVSHGTHTLNFRSRDTAGKWSTIVKEYFFKSIAGTQLSTAEYWIDSDFINRQAIPFTSSNSVFINQSVMTSVTDNQLHTFNFRMQDQAGKWSSVTSSYFMPQSTIVGYDYWFDNNFAQKTSVSVAPTSLLTSQPDFDASSLPNGSHIVHFRAKNNFGKYSVTTSKTFVVDIPPSFTVTATAGANGSISPIGLTNVLTGTNQSFTITPDTCFQIADVLVDGISQGAIASFMFDNVVTIHTISVTFAPLNSTFYQDSDDDGFGNPTNFIESCLQPIGYVLDNTDCDDSQASVYPGATELAYDGLDNNCNGTFDEGFPLLQTNLKSTVCGTTLAFIYDSVGTPFVPVSGITGYRFKAKNLTTGASQTIDRGLSNWFKLTQLPVYDFATTYEISVELQRFGVWLGYFGEVCEVSTPAVPAITSCGLTVPAGGIIRCVATTGVTQYTFKVVNIALGTEQVFNRPSNGLVVNQIPGYSAATPYSVSLAVKTLNGTLSAFGEACTINPASPARFAKDITPTGTEFKAVGSPNPFESNFTLNISSTSDAKVQVAVYDMIGKQLESREVSAQEATALEVGGNYPSGVYNVIVSQGENVKSLRIIKR